MRRYALTHRCPLSDPLIISNDTDLEEDSEGDWVRYSDVVELDLLEKTAHKLAHILGVEKYLDEPTVEAKERFVTGEGITKLPKIMLDDLGIGKEGAHVWFVRSEKRWEACLESELEEYIGGDGVKGYELLKESHRQIPVSDDLNWNRNTVDVSLYVSRHGDYIYSKVLVKGEDDIAWERFYDTPDDAERAFNDLPVVLSLDYLAAHGFKRG